MKTLKEKYGPWALITGASSGIGEAFAKELAQAGLNVVLVARREKRLQKLAAELENFFHIKTITIKLDLTDDNFLGTIKEKTKKLEIGLLVNNAGIGSVGLYSNNGPELEAKMVKLHCLAPTILTHHFAPKMVERKRGGIIFLGSIFSYQPMPYVSTYSATKVFNTFLGKALWQELKQYNVDVLALNPGGTNTEFARIVQQKNSSIAADPADVVKAAIKSLGKKPSVIHGVRNNVWWLISRLMPPRISLAFHAWFTKTTSKLQT